jgi:hypothetical protein
MAHEFAQPGMGMQVCPGCSNTVLNPSITDSSPTSPTACDDVAIKAEQHCKCN